MKSSDRTDLLKDTLVLILAGGRGERLYPLTQMRTKGAVPFGGMYRLIDFTLSNCLHSGLRRICVLPQYKFASLERHLRQGWQPLCAGPGGGVALVPPQQRINENWYQGTADAVYQNLYTLEQEAPAYTLVLSSDHIYRMDYRRLLAHHAHHGADLTIACQEVELATAHRFGIIDIDAHDRVTAFEEKPALPRGIPANPGCALASMGIYVYTTDLLTEVLREDAGRADSGHDFGRDLTPRLVADDCLVHAYNVQREEELEAFYWRDIGEIDAYWEASMELLAEDPPFALDDRHWPIHTCLPTVPPARVMGKGSTASSITNSLICPGSTVVGAQVHRSILSPGVVVERQAEILDSVLLDGVRVGPGARIHRAIIDKGVHVPAGCCIGLDPESDRSRFHVSPHQVVVIHKGAVLSAPQSDHHRQQINGNGVPMMAEATLELPPCVHNNNAPRLQKR